MRRRAVWAVPCALVAAVLAIAVLGFTDAFGSGAVLTGQVSGWSSDGAGGDTFWDTNVLDIPGASLTAVHCHGRVAYVVQVGATGPDRSNPCYAAMGVYSGESSQLDTYMVLPGGYKALYRSAQDNGPGQYCIGNGSEAPAPGPDATGFEPAITSPC